MLKGGEIRKGIRLLWWKNSTKYFWWNLRWLFKIAAHTHKRIIRLITASQFKQFFKGSKSISILKGMYNRKSVLMNLKGGHYNQYKTRSLSSIDSRWLGQDDLPIIDYTKIGTRGISSKKVPRWAISRQ